MRHFDDPLLFIDVLNEEKIPNPLPKSLTVGPNPNKSPTDQIVSLSDSMLSPTDNVESPSSHFELPFDFSHQVEKIII